MKKSFIVTMAILISLLPFAVHAQHTFTNEYSSAQLSSPPLRNYTLKRVHSNATLGKPYTNIKWHAISLDPYAQQAINDWNAVSMFPSYFQFETTETTLNSADIIFTEYGQDYCGSTTALGCYSVAAYSHYVNQKIYTVDYGYAHIYWVNWYGQDPIVKQGTFSHEIGHALGMNHPNITSPPCYGTATVMDTGGCRLAAGISGPTAADGERLWRYYEGCEGASYWCSRLQPYSWSIHDSDVEITWSVKSWNTRYGEFKYYTSDDPSGPWLYQGRIVENDVSGYWEDSKDWDDQPSGTINTNNEYHITVTNNDPDLAAGLYLKVCGRPFQTFYHYGYQNCPIYEIQP